jgi:probable F420-dependent oxidoreductase
MALRIDATMGAQLADLPAAAAAAEELGYAGFWVGETAHDPFLQCLQIASGTRTGLIGTSVAIAFARTPMTVATTSFDLARVSDGRFVLGLGSQIKPHVERRFSMPWSHPVPRMKEFVAALREIWSCWQDGTRLDFRGDFYTHTLMTPYFMPERLPGGAPPILLAGVGEQMTEAAGEVADGFLFHAFATPRYIAEVIRPALSAGRRKRGLDLDGYRISGAVFTAIVDTEEEMAAAIRNGKSQIAFYASTPAYRSVLDLHGWGELQPALRALSTQGRWSEMGDLIDDEVFHAFTVAGTADQVIAELRSRYEGLVDGVAVPLPAGRVADWPRVVG